MFEIPLTYAECGDLIITNFTDPAYNTYYPEYVMVKYTLYGLIVLIILVCVYKRKVLYNTLIKGKKFEIE